MLSINSYSYKKKLLLTICLALVMIIVAWEAAFRKTILAYQEVKQHKNILKTEEQLIVEKRRIESDIEMINTVLGISENSLPSEQLFEEIERLSDKYDHIRIVSFPDIHQIETNCYSVKTISVSFDGDFYDILRLIYDMEQNEKIGKLVSINIKREKDFKRNNDFLRLTIFLQNYELTGKD